MVFVVHGVFPLDDISDTSISKVTSDNEKQSAILSQIEL